MTYPILPNSATFLGTTQLDLLVKQFPSARIFTDEHSRCGEIALFGSLKYGLGGFAQNSITEQKICRCLNLNRVPNLQAVLCVERFCTYVWQL